MNADNPTDAYDEKFFSTLAEPAAVAAALVLPLVGEIIVPKSVVDVGCGAGDWLHEAKRLFGAEVLGVDGAWNTAIVESGLRYMHADLEAPLDLGRRFDLAICLEVAEHLTPDASEQLLDSLTAAADVVIFSAAIPHQPGTNHINCQWQSHWAEGFRRRSFEVFDAFRPAIWDNEDVATWYKQNMLLYCRDSMADDLGLTGRGAGAIDFVHPEHYGFMLAERPS